MAPYPSQSFDADGNDVPPYVDVLDIAGRHLVINAAHLATPIHQLQISRFTAPGSFCCQARGWSWPTQRPAVRRASVSASYALAPTGASPSKVRA